MANDALRRKWIAQCQCQMDEEKDNHHSNRGLHGPEHVANIRSHQNANRNDEVSTNKYEQMRDVSPQAWFSGYCDKLTTTDTSPIWRPSHILTTVKMIYVAIIWPLVSGRYNEIITAGSHLFI